MASTVHYMGVQRGKDHTIAFGDITTASAAEVVQTGLRVIRSVVVTPQTALDDNLAGYSVTIGTNGQFTLNTYKTDGTDPTPAAATVFNKVLSYVAFGY